jgi:hypothetical protein
MDDALGEDGGGIGEDGGGTGEDGGGIGEDGVEGSERIPIPHPNRPRDRGRVDPKPRLSAGVAQRDRPLQVQGSSHPDAWQPGRPGAVSLQGVVCQAVI